MGGDDEDLERLGAQSDQPNRQNDQDVDHEEHKRQDEGRHVAAARTLLKDRLDQTLDRIGEIDHPRHQIDPLDLTKTQVVVFFEGDTAAAAAATTIGGLVVRHG